MSLGNPGRGALDGDDVDQAGQPVLGQAHHPLGPPDGQSAPARAGGGRPPGTRARRSRTGASGRPRRRARGRPRPPVTLDVEVMGAGHRGGLSLESFPRRAAGRAHHRRPGVRDGSACADAQAQVAMTRIDAPLSGPRAKPGGPRIERASGTRGSSTPSRSPRAPARPRRPRAAPCPPARRRAGAGARAGARARRP